MSTKPKLTRNQSLVLDALSASKEPLSAYDVLDRLRGEGLRAPLQIYRALDTLLDKGLVHRLDSLKAFVPCSDPHSHHETAMIAFGICENCARVWEFSDPTLDTRLKSLAAEEGFVPSRTSIEIKGICSNCTASKTTGAA